MAIKFDNEKNAVINPKDVWRTEIGDIENYPKVAISCFSITTFERLVEELNAEVLDNVVMGGANGNWNAYKANYNGMEVLLFMSAVGAPSCVAILEYLTVLGIEKFIIFGTCGSLDRNINDLSIIIPNSAVREEGVSYHYKEDTDEIAANPKYIEDFVEILEEKNVDYTIGKVWTTDAFFRETPQKVKLMQDKGCIAVDMECSAVAAFAEFRGVDVFHFFYTADNLDAKKWDKRSISKHDKLEEKDKVAYLALKLAEKIADR